MEKVGTVQVGYYSKVVAYRRSPGSKELVAIKTAHVAELERRYLPHFTEDGASTITGIEKLLQEVKILEVATKVPGVVKLEEVIGLPGYPPSPKIRIVMSWAGVPLMTFMNDRYVANCFPLDHEDTIIVNTSSSYYDEDTTRLIMKQLVQIIADLHDLCIIHKDIKPDNILVKGHHHVTVIDFSSANESKDGRIFDTQGTVHFSPPELFRPWDYEDEGRRSFDGYKRDAWSLGMTGLVMLQGALPFDYSLEGIRLELAVASIESVELPRGLSENGRSFLGQLLTCNVSSRSRVSDMRLHPWFK